MPAFFSALGLKLLTGLAIAGAVLGVLFGARQSGKTVVRLEGAQEQLKNAKERSDAEYSIGGMSDDDLRDRMRKHWSRD